MALKEFRSQSFKQHELMNMNIANIQVSRNDLPGQTFHGGQQFSDKFALSHDDGYSTDSRSNTTASIYSPLSSSLSSLSTSDGSPNSGSLHVSVPGSQNGGQKLSQMQGTLPGPIQKGPNLHVASKTVLSRNGIIPVRRRGAKVEEPDNLSSLEDRLRALTTIDEEEHGLSMANRPINSNTETDNITHNMGKKNISDKISHSVGTKNVSGINHLDIRNIKITADGLVVDPDSNKMPVYYQAVPVAVTTESCIPSHSSIAERSETTNGEVSIGNVYNHLESGGELTREGWTKYKNFFQKQSDIASHNINIATQGTAAATQGKAANTNVSSSAVAGFQKHQRMGSPGFYREQGDNGVGVVKLDGCTQYLVNQSAQDGGLHRGLGTHEYHHKENDCNSGRNDRLNYVPCLQSQDPAFVYDLQAPMQQYDSQFHGQGHSNCMHQQKANSVLVVADQYANIQPSYTYPVDLQSGNASENQNRVSYTSQSYSSYPSFPQPFPVTSGSPMAGSCDRASWQQLGSSLDQQHLAECRKLTKVGLERNSLDLGNIPKIQKQIRAVSDLCLQASRKHMFASSADIHKLFSGKKKHPVSLQTSTSSNDQEKDQFCDAGFRFSEMGNVGIEASQVGQIPFQPKPKLQVIIPSDSVTGKSSPSQFRVDHNIHIPPEAWVNVTSVPCYVPPEEDQVYLSLQNQPMSPQTCLDKLSYQRTLSASADFSMDRTQANCLSSGYSSESELQQIESNAEAIKKLLKMQVVEQVTNYQVQEFRPLQQSLDRDSNMDRDNYEEMSQHDSVYENQFALTHTQNFDSLHRPLSPRSFSQNTSSLPQSSAFFSNAYQAYMLEKQPQTFRNNSDVVIHNSTTQNIGNTHTYSVNSQNDAASSGNNHLIFADHLTSLDIRGNRPALSHAASVQTYNFAVNHNMKNLSGLKSYGSKSSLPSSPHNPYSPVLSPCNCEDCHTSSAFYLHNGNSKSHVSQPQAQSSHFDYPQTNSSSSYAELQSQEMVHMLNVPFETNVICDEHGNRLSTLV